jgi:hypothetical protein
MRYHLKHVVLDLPHVLLDETTYIFEHKKHGLSLFVSFEPSSPGISPDGVLEELSESLHQGYQGMCVQHFRKPLTFLGEPAAQAFLQLGLAIGGGEVHLLAANGPRHLTLLKFITAQETEDGKGLAMFEHILGSAASAQAPWTRRGGAEGYVRRQAGPLTLEMPEVLGTPRGFSFATQDGSVRLTLQFVEGAPSSGAPDFEEIFPPQQPESRLERISGEEGPFTAAGMRGSVGRWELRGFHDQQELERYLVRALSVQVTGGRTFRALGVARAAGHATLESAWAQLTSTLRPGD